MTVLRVCQHKPSLILIYSERRLCFRKGNFPRHGTFFIVNSSTDCRPLLSEGLPAGAPTVLVLGISYPYIASHFLQIVSSPCRRVPNDRSVMLSSL